jgi:hypothetical protein
MSVILSVIMLSVVMPHVNKLSVILECGIMLNAKVLIWGSLKTFMVSKLAHLSVSVTSTLV